jgi:hypothetical protein
MRQSKVTNRPSETTDQDATQTVSRLSNDLKGLRSAGIVLLLVPGLMFCLRWTSMDSLASGLFFFLSIPVGIMGAAFLLVWALKALKQKVKK